MPQSFAAKLQCEKLQQCRNENRWTMAEWTARHSAWTAGTAWTASKAGWACEQEGVAGHKSKQKLTTVSRQHDMYQVLL